jgi:hypothetical protein
VQVRVYAANTPAVPLGQLEWNDRPATAAGPLAAATIVGTARRAYEWDLTRFLRARRAAGLSVQLVSRVSVELTAIAPPPPVVAALADSVQPTRRTVAEVAGAPPPHLMRPVGWNSCSSPPPR